MRQLDYLCSKHRFMKMPKHLSLSLFFLALFLTASFSPCHAWWDAGHMVTAMIAYQKLDDDVKKECDKLIKALNKEYDYTNHFVAASTWPDDIKGEGVHYYDSWHYTNIPYNPDGLDIDCLPSIDVVWAIENSLKILKSKTTRKCEKARALAFLIHFVGDIHQPLHSTTMYTRAMPNGDRGGNSFMILDPHEKLHALWDDGCGYESGLNDINPYGKPKEPLSKEDLKRLEDFAKKVMAEYPAEKIPFYKNTRPSFWAQESHHLAVKYGYHGINGVSNGETVYLEPWGTPSKLYLENGTGSGRSAAFFGGLPVGGSFKSRNGILGSV